ncbi:hypothetical protein LMH73_018185 [Vibrio splendidus]|nr:hypothetical protein [Vibrio splendidus]MCC4882944.1 hypothetical protein [Vibrio splendidus]
MKFVDIINAILTSNEDKIVLRVDQLDFKINMIDDSMLEHHSIIEFNVAEERFNDSTMDTHSFKTELKMIVDKHDLLNNCNSEITIWRDGERYNVGLAFSDNDCLVITEHESEVSMEFVDESLALLEQLSEKIEDNLECKGNTSEECQLINIRLSIQELSNKISSITKDDIKSN